MAAASLCAFAVLSCAHAAEAPCPSADAAVPEPPVAPAEVAPEPAAPARVADAGVASSPSEPSAPEAIAPPAAIADGTPAAEPSAPAAPPAPAPKPAPDPAPACGPANGARPPAFRWPAPGAVTSPFGMRRGHPHEGIDISSRSGMAVRAAAAGTVVFSDRKAGYGRVIILKHEGGYETVYAHNQDNLVMRGARVKQGQVIADMGNTGESSGPHLHFEVRVGSRPVDPRSCLPARPKGG